MTVNKYKNDAVEGSNIKILSERKIERIKRHLQCIYRFCDKSIPKYQFLIQHSIYVSITELLSCGVSQNQLYFTF